VRSSPPTSSRGGCLRPSRRSAPSRKSPSHVTHKPNISNRNTIEVPPIPKPQPNPNLIDYPAYFQQLTAPTQFPPLVISNRESLRLETRVTPTKQRPDPNPNREKEAWFYGPSREGLCFQTLPPFGPASVVAVPNVKNVQRLPEPRGRVQRPEKRGTPRAMAAHECPEPEPVA
jgi:hypothetical protein